MDVPRESSLLRPDLKNLSNAILEIGQNSSELFGRYQQISAATVGLFDDVYTETSATSVDAIFNYTSLWIADPRRDKLSNYEYIILISTPVLVILGTIGNGLSAMVMIRRRFRRQSTSVYLVALAVSDTTFLYANSMAKNFIKVLFGVNYSTTYAHSCALYVYLLLVSKCLSAWFIVAVTSERLVVVCSPLAGRSLATRRRALIAVISITLIVPAMYSFVLASYVVRFEEDGKIGCAMRESYLNRNVDIILKVFDMVIYSVLPSAILFSCNVALLYKVVQSGKFRKRTSSTRFSPNSRKQQLGQSKRLTMTLLLLSCVYLCLTFPMTAFLCYVTAVDSVPKYQVIFRSLYTLQLTNSAINFFLYTSGPAFRKELKKIFLGSCMAPERPSSLTSLVRSPSMRIPNVSNIPKVKRKAPLLSETEKTVADLPSPMSIVTVC